MPYELNNPIHWDLVIRQTYNVRIVARDPEGRWEEYRSIPDIIQLVSSNILMVGISSTKSKPYWKLGAFASMRLMILPSTTSEFIAAVEEGGKRFFCKLNTLTRIEFPDLNASPYLLNLEIPYWLEQVYVEVWSYSGPTNNEDTAVEINVNG